MMTKDQLARDGLVIRNKSPQAVPASVLVTGDGLEPEAAAESGFNIERKTYAPDGREVAFDKLKQNDRVVVVLKVTEIEPKLGQIVVEDRLPAGFDIENPAVLKGTDLKAFSWLPSTYSPVFSAFRDDRFVAAYSLSDSGRKIPAQMTMAYVMRAVTPGSYTHAGARVEDMYRRDRFARTSGGKVEITAAQYEGTPLADFTPQPPWSLDSETHNSGSISLGCKPALDRHDSDPVVEMHITGEFVPNTMEITSLNVIHETWSGRKYDRSEQYHQTSFFHVPHKAEWVWTGVQIRDLRHTVKGKLWHSNNGWHYSESHFQDGQLVNVVASMSCYSN
ncbi:MAG: hypothetical protein WBX25_31655 [Rhodomicrobium sp.]